MRLSERGINERQKSSLGRAQGAGEAEEAGDGQGFGTGRGVDAKRSENCIGALGAERVLGRLAKDRPQLLASPAEGCACQLAQEALLGFGERRRG